MRLEKTQNAKRNILYGICNKVVVLLLPFAVRTVMIRKLGAGYLGLDSLFSSILQILNLSELGFGTAIVYSMYKPIAENDTDTICALLGFYRAVYRIVGAIILAAGLCLVPFLPSLIKGEYPSDINLYLLYLIYLFNTAVSYMMFAYKTSILNAFQRNDIVSNISSVTKGLMNLIQIILLVLFHNYYIYLIVLPVSTILNNLLVSHSVKKRYPQYLCRGKISESVRKDIRVKVAGLLVTNICGVSRNALDSIFISAFLGLTLTAMYNNYYYVSIAVTGIMAIICTSLQAGIGNSIATDTVEDNYKDMYRLDFIYMLIGGWCSVCMLCLYQPFMEIWVGQDLVFPFGVVVLFVIYFYALKIGDIRTIYVNAAGLWWENRYRAIIEAVSNIILNFVLGKLYGVYGIIIATLISLLVFNFMYGSRIIFKYYFKNGKYGEYLRGHVRYAVVTLCVAVLTYLTCSIVHGNNWLVLIVRAVICCIIPMMLYVFLYYRTDVYRNSIPWILRKFHLEKILEMLIPKDARTTGDK